MWGEITAISALPLAVYCFSHEDNQLFRLKDKISEDLGKDATFYSWLGLKKGAKTSEIVRAYRKLSRTLHPDRNPGLEGNERFARLNQVYKTLTSPLRERYDYYLSVGFPQYNAETDSWFYRRYRPSILFALLLVTLIYTGVQFLVLKTSASRQRSYITGLIDDVRREAAKSSKTGVITEVTKISQGSKVFVVHPNGDVFFDGAKLSPELVEEPTWKDTHAAKLYFRLKNGPRAVESGSRLGTSNFSSESESANASNEKSKEPILKKGAVRRRAPGARGKGKVF